jgi:hypothetical protein
MKRSVLFLIMISMFVASIHAQVGVGGRGVFGVDGNAYGGFELSLQKIDRWEFDLGTVNESWKATGLKLFPLLDRKRIGVYAGGGLGMAYYEPFDDLYFNLAANLGSFIIVGPVQLGLDWRPEWNFYNPPKNNLGFNVAMSARWVFNRRNL